MQVTLLALAAVSLLAAGCGTQTSRPELPSTGGPGAENTTLLLQAKSKGFANRGEMLNAIATKADDSAALRDALQKDYDRVRSVCAPLLYEYKQSTDVARYTSLGIQVLGTIAGAIVVPALAAAAHASKVAIAAWGGTAGVANTLQHTVKEVGLAPLSQYEAREKLRLELLKESTEFAGLYKDFPDKVYEQIGWLNLMKAQCDYPPISVPSDVSPLVTTPPAKG